MCLRLALRSKNILILLMIILYWYHLLGGLYIHLRIDTRNYELLLLIKIHNLLILLIIVTVIRLTSLRSLSIITLSIIQVLGIAGFYLCFTFRNLKVCRVHRLRLFVSFLREDIVRIVLWNLQTIAVNLRLLSMLHLLSFLVTFLQKLFSLLNFLFIILNKFLNIIIIFRFVKRG
jgi:hypothetical protein